MTKLLEQAIEQVRHLPREDQDMAAMMLMLVVERDAAPYRLTASQIAEVKRTQKAVHKGKIATDAEMAALWKKFGVA